MVGFDIDKTIQSSAYLLKLTNGRSNYMRLLKLLYLAERLSLQNRKSPISGDRPIAMERGPVPSRTLDMIKGHDPKASQWDAYFSRDNYDILLDDDPGNLALSRAELKILEETFNRFAGLDEWDLVDWCHKNLPEYEKTWAARGDKSAKWIPLEDILEEIGLPGRAKELVAQVNERTKFAKFFGDHLPSTS